MKEPSGLQGSAAGQQLPGSWAETAGIERRRGMQARSFALGHVPVWAVLPSREQHPQKALLKDEVVPVVHAVLAPLSDLQRHAVPSKGRWDLLQDLQEYGAMLIFPVRQAQGWGPGAMGVTGSPAVTSREHLRGPLRNSGCMQRGEMNLSFWAANKAHSIHDLL